jgi:hypothetical protein
MVLTIYGQFAVNNDSSYNQKWSRRDEKPKEFLIEKKSLWKQWVITFGSTRSRPNESIFIFIIRASIIKNCF